MPLPALEVILPYSRARKVARMTARTEKDLESLKAEAQLQQARRQWVCTNYFLDSFTFFTSSKLMLSAQTTSEMVQVGLSSNTMCEVQGLV